MASRFYPPVFQQETSAGIPYAGGTLTFYASGTSSPLDTYSNNILTIVNPNPITLNSAGWPDNDIFLQNLPYKVVLKDSSGNTIWTKDPVTTTDFQSVTVTKVGSGDPNGSVAGTAGSSGVLPTVYWDYTNQILYVCTTTGSSSTAVWTAVNASAATAVVTAPQGYLTPTSGTPVITTEVSAGTAVYYTPFVGNLIPIYNGSRMVPTEFSELTLTLSASHLANQIYDVFVFSNSGVVTIATGPAWATPTAGSGDRGTGASTTELTRLNGYWVNKVQITARNGATTYTIAADNATYVGSIFMDGTNGQITCHRTWGQSRKWGIWNAYNRQPLYLKAGDSTASWVYTTNTARASNNASANSLTVFIGLTEEWFRLDFRQKITVSGSGAGGAVDLSGSNRVGWNSTTAGSGNFGLVGIATTDFANDTSGYGTGVASYLQAPSLGINIVTALEIAPTTTNPATGVTWFGGEDDMVLTAYWCG